MSSRSKFGATRGTTHSQSFGPMDGLEAAFVRPDLQTEWESQGMGDERFRGIANMGPEFDRAFGRPANPGNRPDLPANAFHQRFVMHGDVNKNGIAGDPSSNFNLNPDIPGNLAHVQAQLPGYSGGQVIAGLRAAANGWQR